MDTRSVFTRRLHTLHTTAALLNEPTLHEAGVSPASPWWRWRWWWWWRQWRWWRRWRRWRRWRWRWWSWWRQWRWWRWRWRIWWWWRRWRWRWRRQWRWRRWRRCRVCMQPSLLMMMIWEKCSESVLWLWSGCVCRQVHTGAPSLNPYRTTSVSTHTSYSYFTLILHTSHWVQSARRGIFSVLRTIILQLWSV